MAKKPATKKPSATGDEATLLKQVHAALDDDAPRMVLADVWTSQGNPQGELIVVQCALAKLAVGDPKRAALEKRERALLRDPAILAIDKKLRERFPIGGREDGYKIVFRRGFVAEIPISADRFKEYGRKVFAEIPTIDGLDMAGCPVCYSKLIPELGKLRHFTVGLGRSEHIPHLDIEELKNVHTLAISNAALDSAIAELVAWKTLRPRRLRLPKASMRDKGARVLADAKLDLDELDLRKNKIGPDAAAALRKTYGERVLLD